MKKLIFIDTNIYLDFYRMRNEGGTELLKHIESKISDIVVTYQIESEFKKNRQAVIIDSITNLKQPPKISRPAFLSENKSWISARNSMDKLEKNIKDMKARLKGILVNSAKYDPVYQVTQRIFKKADKISLTRESDDKRLIRAKAFRRFICGYPPRKSSDTSMGDSINWEWIIRVSEKEKCDMIIVSRDSDYGVNLDGEYYINDWLDQEFKDRVSQKRKLKLFGKLTDAMKYLKIDVSKKEEDAEQSVAATLQTEEKSTTSSATDWQSLVSMLKDSYLNYLSIKNSDRPKEPPKTP